MKVEAPTDFTVVPICSPCHVFLPFSLSLSPFVLIEQIRIELDGFSWYFISEMFNKICPQK
jgi:hypothetical protein